MPIYEYKCRKCGKEFEISQRITEDSLTLCPELICEQEEKGTGEVYRKISKNVGLSFKGTGFYLTDYTNRKISNSTSSSSSNSESSSKETSSIKSENKVKESAA